MPGRARALSYVAVLAAVAALGCNLNNPGDLPPPGLLYFPNAIALSKHADGEAPRYLLVANSDFDLRYKTGSVQALSLDKVQAGVDACKKRKTSDCEIDSQDVLEDEMLISPFSTALGVSPDGRTLFAATRTDKSLGFIDLDAAASGDNVLKCKGATGRCPLYSEPGPNRFSDGDLLAWPVDPVAIIAGPLSDVARDSGDVTGDYVIVAHRAGEVSLFVPQPPDKDGNSHLLLTDTLNGLPQYLTELAYDPDSGFVHLTVAAGAGVKVLARIGVTVPRDANGTPDNTRAFLYDADAIQLDAVAPYRDTRDLAFVPALSSAGADFAQGRALVIAHDPSALLLVDVDPSQGARTNAGGETVAPFHARVEGTVVVGAGASRLDTGSVAGKRLAIVSCFDSRELYVIDLETMLTRGVIPNLSGPFEVALDEQRKLAYVADFRSSVIRVIDLAPLSEGRGDQPISVVATLGKPKVLQELQ